MLGSKLHKKLTHKKSHPNFEWLSICLINYLSLKAFFTFMLKSGWSVAYHEQHFIPGNSLYNIGMKKVLINNDEAMEFVNHFDWDSIRDKKDLYNKFVLVAPPHLQDTYAFKNPFETFASIYEKTM